MSLLVPDYCSNMRKQDHDAPVKRYLGRDNQARLFDKVTDLKEKIKLIFTILSEPGSDKKLQTESQK